MLILINIIPTINNLANSTVTSNVWPSKPIANNFTIGFVNKIPIIANTILAIVIILNILLENFTASSSPKVLLTSQ